MELSQINTENYTIKQLLPFETIFLRCSVCLKFLTVPPVYFSSSSGIKVCGRCTRAFRYFRSKGDMERAKMVRDTMYEEFAKLIFFSCSYLHCPKLVRFGDFAEQHEATCEHKHLMCPISQPNRWYVRNGEGKCDCNRTFLNEKQMIEHIEDEHIDYVLPGPSVHYRYLFLPSERRRMFIWINDGKMAVLLTRKQLSKFCIIRCRTFPTEGTDVCEISIKDLQTEEYIIKRNIVCGPLDGDDSREADQVFWIRLDVLPARAMFNFHIRKKIENEKLNDSKEDIEHLVKGFVLL